ncbi:hypothetical protein ACXR0O_16435 [Verrucomicrobiota bacterium sgz303538]
MATTDSVAPYCYRVTHSAILESRMACIRLDTSYYGFVVRHGLVSHRFLVTLPDASTLEIRASAARINTANPHAAHPLLVLQPPLPTVEIPAGSYISAISNESGGT